MGRQICHRDSSCSFRYSAARADNLPHTLYTLYSSRGDKNSTLYSYIQIHLAFLCLFDEALINIYHCASCFSFGCNSSIYMFHSISMPLKKTIRFGRRFLTVAVVHIINFCLCFFISFIPLWGRVTATSLHSG
jgi:hypothetical protein